MNEPETKKLNPLVPVVAAIAVTIGVWFGLQMTRPHETTAVTLLPGGRALPEIAMTDHHGNAYGRANLEGRWSLVFMGFTNCGHVCPMTMAEMSMIRDGVGDELNVVFLSVDPGRDTTEIIHDYVRSFNPRFAGITGEPAEIDKLATGLGAPYFITDTGDSYTVDHSSTLFLIDPSASLAGVISQPLDIDAIVEDLRQIL